MCVPCETRKCTKNHISSNRHIHPTKTTWFALIPMLKKHRNIPLWIFLLVVSCWSPFFHVFMNKPFGTRGGVYYESKTHISHSLRTSHCPENKKERDMDCTQMLWNWFSHKDVFFYFSLYLAAFVLCVYIHTFPECNCLPVTCQTLPKATVELASWCAPKFFLQKESSCFVNLFDFCKDPMLLSLFGFVNLYDVADFNWVLQKSLLLQTIRT